MVHIEFFQMPHQHHVKHLRNYTSPSYWDVESTSQRNLSNLTADWTCSCTFLTPWRWHLSWRVASMSCKMYLLHCNIPCWKVHMLTGSAYQKKMFQTWPNQTWAFNVSISAQEAEYIAEFPSHGCRKLSPLEITI